MADAGAGDLDDRRRTRERLGREKPKVLQKLLALDERAARGDAPPPVIEVAYRYACNLTCEHCFASNFEKKERSLSLEDMRDLARQATEMGVHQFILQGGEPIMWPDLDEVVAAIDPSEFYLGLVTNSTLLDAGRVDHLRAIGVDKIVMSLDSFDKREFEENRKRAGLFQHVLEMLDRASDAGLRVVINTVATKQNVRDAQLLRLVDYAKERGFIVYVNFATAIGSWEGRYDLLLEPEDADYIFALNKEHEIIKRDIYPYRGRKVPCPALRSVVYVTEYGDVLPCPFLHISMGSLFEEPLADILERGLKLDTFRDPKPMCLAAEDRDFIKTRLSRTYGKPAPVDAREIFLDETD
jgi:MoaA/NifB/PqqE/SkfB family radical SAM enzyme